MPTRMLRIKRIGDTSMNSLRGRLPCVRFGGYSIIPRDHTHGTARVTPIVTRVHLHAHYTPNTHDMPAESPEVDVDVRSSAGAIPEPGDPSCSIFHTVLSRTAVGNWNRVYDPSSRCLRARVYAYARESVCVCVCVFVWYVCAGRVCERLNCTYRGHSFGCKVRTHVRTGRYERLASTDALLGRRRWQRRRPPP